MVASKHELPILVFPGQGAQAVGMGRDLAEALPEVRALFARADELLGQPLTRVIFEGPESALVETATQQPALVLASLAVLKALELKTGQAVAGVAAAGLSLGEITALAAAGALTFEDALRLARRRGEAMQDAAARNPGGMAVVLHLDEQRVRAACAQAARETQAVVAPCNFNGGGQIVIGGALAALERAIELCRAAGARRTHRLPVSGAFHTPLMGPAALALRETLARTPFVRARIPVYANVSAALVQEPDDIRSALERQVTQPVLWEQTVKNLVSAGHTRFLEVGPGKTLSNMIKRIAPHAETRAVGTWHDVESFAKA